MAGPIPPRAAPAGLRRVAALGSGALVVLSLAACGRKMPPEAPLQVIPARVEPLRVTQEGSDVVLRFPYPSRTAAGETLTDLTGVTVLRELLPAPKGAKPPETPTGEVRDRAERDFRARAQPVAVLNRSGLDDATEGGDVVVRDSLFPLAKAGQLSHVFLRYGVVAARDAKRKSPMSPLVSIFPLVPPDAPQALAGTVEERRVCLSWVPPEQMIDGFRPVRVGAYAVYRRGEKDEIYEQPVGVVTLGWEYVDETAQAGRRYVYTVRAAPTADRPLVLGPPADELLVDTRDVFPPATPEGLLVLAEEKDNRLVWNPVLSADLAGYRVWRRVGSGPWELAGETTVPTYVDASAPAGAEYGVSAYDRIGNESPRATMKKSEGETPR